MTQATATPDEHAVQAGVVLIPFNNLQGLFAYSMNTGANPPPGVLKFVVWP